MVLQKDLMEDPVKFVLFGILRDLTNGMWKVSGEGSGGISRAFGEGLWEAVDDLISLKTGKESKTDRSTPGSAMEGLIEMSKLYELVDDIDYEFKGGSLKISVHNCSLHHYTDAIAGEGVPRSVGCPYALSCVAMMQEVTGELFEIENIESSGGNSEIVIKQL